MAAITTADKIKRAKIQLILSEPFFATLLMGMETKEDNSIKTVATNGQQISYNAKYIDSISTDEAKGLLCSAIMKVANLHHLRRAGRDTATWSKASDYSVNPIIKNAGFKLPKEALHDSQYKDLSAEQIFNLIPGKEEGDSGANGQQDTPDGQQGTGSGQPQPGNGQEEGDEEDNNAASDPNAAAVEVQDSPAKTEGERQEQEAKTKQRVAQAIQIAQRGKKPGDVPGYIQELIDDILTAKINWHEVLARFITDIARNDYSYKKPNTRFLHTGFYLPSLYNEEPGRVVFLVDTSGSIDEELFFQFAGELQEVSNEIKTPVTVIYVDTQVQGVQEIEPDEKIKLEIKGRGGTKFSPGFKYIEEQQIEAKAIVYLTDGDCNEFPETEPDMPTLWAVYNNHNFKPPFGEVIEIN